MKYLYTNGGVILKNPSTIGGTYAWCIVENGEIVDRGSGYITPESMYLDVVTNNQAELYAVLRGLAAICDNEIVEIRSDSEITLGRIFKNYSFNNIPEFMTCLLKAEKNRLKNFRQFKYTLMDGHPTQAQVDKGFGKQGHVTSKFNVWCDKECGRQAAKYLNSLVPA